MKNLVLLSVAVLAASVALFGRSCLGGHFVVDASQTADVYYLSVLYERFGEHLAAGHYPFLFPEFGGYPVASAWMYGLYYPPTALFALLPPDLGWTVSAILHLLLAAIGMHLFLRRVLENPIAAATGALIYAFSEYMVGRSICGHLNLVWPAAWAPWALWAAGRAVRFERGGVPILGIVLGLGLISGHVQSWFYLAPLIAAYAHCEVGSGSRLRALGRFAAGVGMALGIAATQWSSTLELVSVSGPPDLTDTPVEEFGATPVILAAKVFPGYLGELGDGYRGGTRFAHESFAIGGLSVLLLAALGLAGPRRKRWFWACVVLAGLLLAPGRNFAPSAWLNDLPLLSWGRATGRALLLAVLGVSVLAGHGAAAWLDRERPLSRRRVISACAATAAVALLAFMGLHTWLQRTLPPDIATKHLSETGIPAVLGGLLGVVAVAAALAVCRRWPRAALLLPLTSLAVVAATAVPSVRTVASDFYFEDLSRDLPDDAKFHGIYVNDERYPYLERQGYLVHRPMSNADAAWYMKVLTSGSGNVLRWIDLKYMVEGVEAERLIEEPSYSGTKVLAEYPACGPFVWFSSATSNVADEDAFRLLGGGARSLLIVGAEPEDPRTQSPIAPHEVKMWDESAPGDFTLYVSTPAPGWIYVSRKYYPFWKAEMDGRTVTVYRANISGMAVRVPAGDHRIEFEFAPLSATLGPWVSLASLLLCLTLIVYRRKQ